MTLLLETNVISEMRKKRPDPNVWTWFGSVSSADLYLSVMVVGEIRRGIEALRSRDPERAEQTEAWLASIRHHYEDRILPVSTEVAEEWGRLDFPYRVAPVDGLMAATARVHGFTLVTRKTVHVGHMGVPLLNPFEPLRARRS